MKRDCIVCGTALNPYRAETLTAHEFACYKREPEKVPAYHAKGFAETLKWEKRSSAAKKAAIKRRKA